MLQSRGRSASEPEPLPGRSSRSRRLLHPRTALLALLLLPALGPSWGGNDDADPVPLLREARELWAANSLRKARRKLESAEKSPLADHAGLLRMRLLRTQGDFPAALEAGEQALTHEPPSEVRARILEELAQVHLAVEDLPAAEAAQRGAWEASQDSANQARLVLDLARELDKRDRGADALRLYDKIWTTWPLSAQSVDAYARAVTLTRSTGAAKPSADQVTDRARRLTNAFQCLDALPLFEEVLARPELDAQQRATAERGRADCLFQRRRYPESAEAFAALAKADPEDIQAAIFAARSQGRAGNRDRAVKELKAIAKRAKQGADVAQAQYLLADLLPSHGKKAETKEIQRLFRAVADQKDDPGLARQANWSLAWQDFRAARHADALKRLETLSVGSKWDIEVQRARYWAAAAKLELDPAAGRTRMEAIARELPLSYYGLLAADRLGIAVELERPFLGARKKSPPEGPELRTRWLIAAGLEQNARDEIASWILGEKLSREERLAAAPLLHALGEHYQAARVVIGGFGDALDQGIDPAWRDAWREAWPAPFGLSVRDAAQEFGTGTALVYAVMREESLYRPEVESAAGARGLMQLIEPTAKTLANTLRVDAFEASWLYKPEVNIRFGTLYLTQLLERFRGSRHQAIAAYNAGPHIVEPWNAEYGPLPEDAFVDSVPYSETRRYLRRVLRSYRMYQILYGAARVTSEIRASR